MSPDSIGTYSMLLDVGGLLALIMIVLLFLIARYGRGWIRA